MNNKKFLAVLLIAFLVGVVAVVAYTTWQGTITWTAEEKTEFSVWGSLDGDDELGQTGDPPHWSWEYIPQEPLKVGDSFGKTFYLQNDGTIQFSVTVAGTPSKCIALWNGLVENTYILSTDTKAGYRIPATLVLEITEAGTGSYDFSFGI